MLSEIRSLESNVDEEEVGSTQYAHKNTGNPFTERNTHHVELGWIHMDMKSGKVESVQKQVVEFRIWRFQRIELNFSAWNFNWMIFSTRSDVRFWIQSMWLYKEGRSLSNCTASYGEQ